MLVHVFVSLTSSFNMSSRIFCGEDRRFILFCIYAINNVFKNFVTKEMLRCEFDWFIHTPCQRDSG